MAVSPKVAVTTKQFDAYLLALKRKMGRKATWETLIKGEAASILAAAAGFTGRAKAGDIRKKYTIKARRKKLSKGGITPQNEKLVPFIPLEKGGKKYYTKNYYPQKVWDRLKARMKFYEDRAVARIFSGKATWFLCAKKAGIKGAALSKFEASASINKAISAQAGSYKSNSTENGTERAGMFKYAIEIFNAADCCLNQTAKGTGAMKRAIKGRLKFFRENNKHGVFKDAQQMATKYPGVMVKKSS
tara:strand:+ start:3158 stop:3892 length:735 start_codon:yes stop_codon:yes gene_type:complete